MPPAKSEKVHGGKQGRVKLSVAMSMSVQESLLLYDGEAWVNIAEVDLDQLVSVRTDYPLNIGQGSGFVVRYRNFGIVVCAEIL